MPGRLKQKISDAGPSNQRIDPHILTITRKRLQAESEVLQLQAGGIPWFHLAKTKADAVQKRLATLLPIHRQTHGPRFLNLLGQTMEIAVFRGLAAQTALPFLGHFLDLDAHDDSSLYRKEDPPSALGGRRIPNGKRLDFIVTPPTTGGSYGGIEVKNIREWIYPNRAEIRDLLFKCCSLDVVPVLIARRIHYSTFSVLNPCGVILHQTFNQLYPRSASALALRVRDKRALGYHDVRVGNEPDQRLLRFLHVNLPKLLPNAHRQFQRYKDLLCGYASGAYEYKSFAARVKRRMRGQPEDLPPFEAPPEEPEEWEDI